MKKIRLALLCTTLLSSSTLLAAGIEFIENKSWKEVLSMAKRQKKLVFLDAYATWCGPCKYLQKNVFTESEVGDYFNSNFINVAIDMEEGEGVELARKYAVTSYPTLFFIDGDGNLVHKTVGAMDTEDFIALGKKALNPETQYFTVKKKAVEGKLKPEAFHTWVHEAEAMEDEDAADVINAYLSSTTYPLLEEEMLSLIMDHASSLSQTHLDVIYRNRAEAARLLEVEEDAFDAALMKFVTAYSRKQAESRGTLDFSLFTKSMEAYFPAKALLETQKMKVSYHVAQENSSQALAALTDLITNASYATPVSDMAMAVVDAANLIYDAGKTGEFIKKVQRFSVKAADKKNEYYKDLALLMLHYRNSDREQVKTYADKILNNPLTPEAMTEVVKSFLE